METRANMTADLIMDDILDGKIILFKIASNVSSLWSFPMSTIEMLLTYEQSPWYVGGLHGTPGGLTDQSQLSWQCIYNPQQPKVAITSVVVVVR